MPAIRIALSRVFSVHYATFTIDAVSDSLEDSVANHVDRRAG